MAVVSGYDQVGPRFFCTIQNSRHDLAAKQMRLGFESGSKGGRRSGLERVAGLLGEQIGGALRLFGKNLGHGRIVHGGANMQPGVGSQGLDELDSGFDGGLGGLGPVGGNQYGAEHYDRMAPEMTNPSTTLSKNHQLVYEILEERGTGTHLTMAELHAVARERRPGIGFTTVYRALARLRDLRLVSEIAVPGAESLVYELPGSPHAHFRCSQCGKIQDVAYAFPASIAGDLAGAAGFEVDSVELSLHGRCRDCQTA